MAKPYKKSKEIRIKVSSTFCYNSFAHSIRIRQSLEKVRYVELEYKI